MNQTWEIEKNLILDDTILVRLAKNLSPKIFFHGFYLY